VLSIFSELAMCVVKPKLLLYSIVLGFCISSISRVTVELPFMPLAGTEKWMPVDKMV